jgi:DnaJ-class molecular chaperone
MTNPNWLTGEQIVAIRAVEVELGAGVSTDEVERLCDMALSALDKQEYGEKCIVCDGEGKILEYAVMWAMNCKDVYSQRVCPTCGGSGVRGNG